MTEDDEDCCKLPDDYVPSASRTTPEPPLVRRDYDGNPIFDLYEILEMVRVRPGLYVGSLGLDRPGIGDLRNFIHAFWHAMSLAGVRDVGSPDFGLFHEYVRAHYGYSESTAGWCNMILAAEAGCDPQEYVWDTLSDRVTPRLNHRALHTFFRLLDDFRVNPPADRRLREKSTD